MLRVGELYLGMVNENMTIFKGWKSELHLGDKIDKHRYPPFSPGGIC